MRPDPIVVLAPFLHQHLSFLEPAEHLAVQQLIAQLAVEGFDVAVFPRARVLNVGRLGANADDPGGSVAKSAASYD